MIPKNEHFLPLCYARSARPVILRSHGVMYNAFVRRKGTVSTLPEVLRRNGYRTGAFVHALVLDSRFGLEEGFDTYADTYTEKTFARTFLMKLGLYGLFARHDHSLGLHVNEFALPWMTRGGRKPFFAWVHYFDAHEPCNPPAELRRRFTKGMTSRIDPSRFRASDLTNGSVHLKQTLCATHHTEVLIETKRFS
jgi:arylsulfatase A-like enzyme